MTHTDGPTNGRLKTETRYAAGFVLAGASGFVVDALVLWALLALGLGPTPARVVSIAAAVATTFTINHTLTFAGHDRTLWRALALYIASQMTGIAVNFGVYVAAIRFAPPPFDLPHVALVLGIAAAIPVTYLGARFVAFRRKGAGG